ncbi:putative Rho guanyl nucleotide exchange factor [Aspergillus ellipticus CBS 707.79]|uniref:Putative Rho guanyl nucleotide exchange factor n=1 Tax=Aspergillus ellipticus CBS 707.79 TaxID=1448320 RepID=A0A319CWI3_9EURO|nr:putative Rho guanyl nucleotide exchange factor [Aspergillus ellipticus CBS 707.79]
MAHYQNGYPTYSQPPNSPPSSTQPTRYDLYPPQPASPQLRRMPSYNVGDDAGVLGSPQSQNSRAAEINAQYAGWNGSGDGQSSYNLTSAGHEDYSDPRYAHLPAASPHARAASQSSYQYQYASPGAAPMSPTQGTYNPQQYALPPTPSQQQVGFSPLTYGPPPPGHQPYNPAAYQPAGFGASPVQRQPTNAYAQAPPTPQSYGPPHPQLPPPPPPPRGADHPYGGRPSPVYGGVSPGTQYGFATQQASSSSALSPNSLSYGLASPSTPSTGYSTAQSYAGGGQVPAYLSQSPSRSEGLMASPFDDPPPAPPAHSSTEDAFGKRSSLTRPGSGRSLPTPPIHQTPPQMSPQRTDTLTRHPQSRPLPGTPVDADTPSEPSSNGAGGANYRSNSRAGYNALIEEVGAVVANRRRAGTANQTRDPLAVDTNDGLAPEPSSGVPLGPRLSPDERHTHTNGSIATGTGQYVNYDAYSDDSDAEAAAGLAMLHMADEEEKAEAERQQERGRRETTVSIISAYGAHSDTQDPRESWHPDESGSYGGSYRRASQYGEADYQANGYDDADNSRLVPTLGSLRSSNLSPDERGEFSDDYDYPSATLDAYQTKSPQQARVDAVGTGGLLDPGAYARRMSFDYGDETDTPLSQQVSHQEHLQRSESDSSGRGEEPGDLFFHPGMRPLPPAPVEPASNPGLMSQLMPAGTYRHPEQGDVQSSTQYKPSYFPVAPDSYSPTVPSSSQVPRSTSLSSHPIGPRTDPPIRSKTDADRAKYKQQQEQLRQQQYGALGLDVSPDSAAAMTLDLPTIPAGRRKKFNPAKLSSEQFRRCAEPWALSSILSWIRELSEEETDLKEQAIVDAIVALFTHKVPTMNMADAETLAARVVKNMLAEEAIVKDEEWVKFGNGTLTGVLFQITGTGCYSSRLHEHGAETFGRCYSHHCMRTLKKVNLKAQLMEPEKKAEDWVTFYKVPKELWETYPKKEIDRQNNLHEIVTTEDSYISQLDVLRELYRDQLEKMEPSVIAPKRLTKFLNDVFSKVDPVKKVNEDYLLAQLKYRQKEQGPFIGGFSDIFREWIRKAKTVYVDYAATFPSANYLVRKEAERNIHFRQFLNQARDNKLSNRLSWDTYLKAPITRIQRYTLLLSTVHKNMPKDSEEKANLAQAIEEIKMVALECDNKVGEMSKKVDLMELASKLQLRPEMKAEVELNLEHLGREVIFRGDLQRPGTRTRFLVDTHAILFDHYLVLAKAFTARDPSRTVKYESYDVSKLPIPMDLLVLESTNDDPVVKSSVRGVATVTPPQAVGRGVGVGPLTHTASGNSASSGNSNSGRTLVPATVLESSKDDKILYPFKIKHLGKNGTYTLYAFSAQNRQDWCEKIEEAKTKHAAALFAQNAEPFRLRVLADTAFASSESSSPSTSITIEGTPLDRAIKEVEDRYSGSKQRPLPICRAAVHCATVFQQPAGKMMCAIGTDYGVYISEYNDPRGWARAIPIVRVTQIAVFEEFNVFLLIADRSLIAYHLDVVCPPGGVAAQTTTDSSRKAPQKLSGSREVGFFAAGHMKDRTLVMYKKRDGLSSTFKILEPVVQKSSSSRSRLFHSRRSQTEFFREYDEFYIPAESYGINLFHSSLAISTQRGIEILTIDKKHTWSVPDFRSEAPPEAQAQLTSIAHRIGALRPLGMFRLSDSEFLVVYTECAVYVNKHGDVSRSVVMEFVGHAHSACLYGKFLILFNEDFVEVRNAMNGRLRQVIPGHGVVCLDDGSSMPGSGANSIPTSAGGAVNLSSGLSNGTILATGGRTVKICMQHPEYERSQIILELIENEGQKD